MALSRVPPCQNFDFCRPKFRFLPPYCPPNNLQSDRHPPQRDPHIDDHRLIRPFAIVTYYHPCPQQSRLALINRLKITVISLLRVDKKSAVEEREREREQPAQFGYAKPQLNPLFLSTIEITTWVVPTNGIIIEQAALPRHDE